VAFREDAKDLEKGSMCCPSRKVNHDLLDLRHGMVEIPIILS